MSGQNLETYCPASLAFSFIHDCLLEKVLIPDVISCEIRIQASMNSSCSFILLFDDDLNVNFTSIAKVKKVLQNVPNFIN